MTTAFQQNAFQDNAFQIDAGVVVTPPSAIDVYAPSGGRKRRRYRHGDDELTEGELQWMFRKIAELKKAKVEAEQERIAKELEVALAQAAHDEEAAEVIATTIEEDKQEELPRVDYSGVMRDTALLSKIVRNLQILLHEYQMQEEEDIAAILLTT